MRKFLFRLIVCLGILTCINCNGIGQSLLGSNMSNAPPPFLSPSCAPKTGALAPVIYCGPDSSSTTSTDSVASSSTASTSSESSSASGGLQMLGFWESWKDTTVPLSSTPAKVTAVAVAFSTSVAGGTLANAQNTNPLTTAAATLHKNGTKILISFGGATGTGAYAGLDANSFVTALSAFFTANPGVYDGVDFDDEADPRAAQPLIDVITATRAKFPNIIITYDAFPSGADTGTGKTSDWQGSDIAVAAAVAPLIDWVNVMDYNFGSWKPTTHQSCTVSQSASDDCRRDVLQDFALLYPKNKIVMGLEVPTDDNGVVGVSTADVGAYASWVKTNGYRGIMIWDLDRDPNFGYTNAITGGLGL